MPQPVLRTTRLLLVPLADRHLDLEVRLDADPEVLRHLFGRARTRTEVTAAHARRRAEALPVDGLGHWMAFTSADGVAAPPDEAAGDAVGLLMLPPDEAEPGVAELGYRLERRYWRRGLATEASRELLRHGFDTLGLHRVYARTMAVNAASRGVMTALGMRHARTLFPHWDEPLPGAELGEVEYELTRDAWRALPGRCRPPAGRGGEG